MTSVIALVEVKNTTLTFAPLGASAFLTLIVSIPMTSMMPIPLLTRGDVLRPGGVRSFHIEQTGVVLSGSKLIASESHLNSSRVLTY